MIKIYKYGEVSNAEIFSRFEPETNVESIVADIIENVRTRGDAAILEYAEKFDGAKMSSLEVTEDEISEAVSSVKPEFIETLRKAAKNIREFHSKEGLKSFETKYEDGRVLGQRVMPIEKVGLYVPGGTAAYPSTVLMDSIPAKIAGTSEIVMVTPPNKEGKVNPNILAAAWVAGVDRIFKVGGAQAVAALTFGTKTVPKVDKIVGPGNAFVAEAKKQVFGMVSIDMIAGPSEILVVADSAANPVHVAADMLSQAEHDKNASAVLVTDSFDLAQQAAIEIEKQLCELPRQSIARPSIDNNGKIIVAENIDVVIDIANEIAPEHLELAVANPFLLLDKIKHAGSIFLGYNCPEALGDYFAGPNHTLPTSGTARFSSALSVEDFQKKSQYIYYERENLEAVKDDIAAFAETEGLSGHARSVTKRFDD